MGNHDVDLMIKDLMIKDLEENIYALKENISTSKADKFQCSSEKIGLPSISKNRNIRGALAATWVDGLYQGAKDYQKNNVDCPKQ